MALVISMAIGIGGVGVLLAIAIVISLVAITVGHGRWVRRVTLMGKRMEGLH